MYDVAVIGGGPIGCFAAHLLAKKGFHCAVLEEHPSSTYMITCTGILSLAAFGDFNLPRSAILSELRSAKFISPSGIAISVSAKEPKAYLVDPEAFVRDLFDLASAEEVDFFFNFPVSKVQLSRNGVRIEGGDRGRRSIEAAVVVVATGIHYELLDQLGMGKPSFFVEAAQVEAEVEGVEEVEVYFGRRLAPGSFAWLVPLPTEKARIGLITKSGAPGYLREFLRSSFIGPRLKRTYLPLRVRPIPMQALQRSYLDRILIAGDAAGQVKPTTGGGLYYGFIGATAAAETIADAFSHGDFRSGFLRQYEQRWRRRIGLELRVGTYFRRLASTIDDTQIDHLLNACKEDALGEIIRRASDFDSHRKLILQLLRHPLFWKTLRRTPT